MKRVLGKKREAKKETKIETPEALTTTTTEKASETITGNLVEEVNKRLGLRNDNEAHYDTSPQTFIDYLKTLKLPQGVKIEDAKPTFDKGNLTIHADLSLKKGPLTIHPILDATIENNPSGGLNVPEFNLDKLGFLKGKAEGELRSFLNDLNTNIKNLINKQIDQNWEATNFQILDNKIAVDFKKKV